MLLMRTGMKSLDRVCATSYVVKVVHHYGGSILLGERTVEEEGGLDGTRLTMSICEACGGVEELF